MAHLPRNLSERVQFDQATRRLYDGLSQLPPDNAPYRGIESIARAYPGAAASSFISEATDAMYRRAASLYDRLVR